MRSFNLLCVWDIFTRTLAVSFPSYFFPTQPQLHCCTSTHLINSRASFPDFQQRRCILPNVTARETVNRVPANMCVVCMCVCILVYVRVCLHACVYMHVMCASVIIIIIITYIYNALNDTLSASRIHNKLKTILSKYIHIQNSPSLSCVQAP